MKPFITIILLTIVTQLCVASKPTIVTAQLVSTPAVFDEAAQHGQGLQLNKLLQSINQRLVSELHKSGRFEILATGLAQDTISHYLSRSNNRPTKHIPDYFINLELTDFSDVSQTQILSNGDNTAKRTVRATASVKIWKIAAGSINVCADQTSEKQTIEMFFENTKGAHPGDKNIADCAQDLSHKLVNEILFQLNPPCIVAIVGNEVIINRGQSTGIVIGQSWNIFTKGEDIIDPDTGEKLGNTEVISGVCEVNRVEAKIAHAKIIKNISIKKGDTARILQ